QVERLLRGALRHRDGRCAGAGRSSARSVPVALDILGPSDRFVKPRRVLAVLAASELCGMAPWFSASAVAPALSRVWRLDSAGGAWLTISVQLGFVAGALVSALLTLSDRRSARRLVAAAAAAFVGGGLVLLVPHDGPFAAPAPPFSWRAAPRILANRAVSLANLGYLGHMWELYAMWTWLAAFVAASELARTGGAAAGSR